MLTFPSFDSYCVLLLLQINVYALGRAYLKLSNALHINPPAIGSVGSSQFLAVVCTVCDNDFLQIRVFTSTDLLISWSWVTRRMMCQCLL